VPLNAALVILKNGGKREDFSNNHACEGTGYVRLRLSVQSRI